MKCEKCGYELNEEYKMCPICGTKITNKEVSKIDNTSKNRRKTIFILGIVLVIIIITIGVILYQTKSEKIEVIRKSVVMINAYDKSGEIIQTGSGFVVFDKNILVTNAHVITDSSSIDAISEDDEKLFINGAIYYNQDEDIAILKLNKQNKLKPLKISTNYKVGDKVIAIGSPLGIKNSVSDGVISNIIDNEMIQHSAPISPGSSGGALFNHRGQVIGINKSGRIDGQNINFAIPIKTIEKAYARSKNNKVKSVKKIQYINDDIKIIMLNNQAGKKLVKLVNVLEKHERNVFAGDPKNYKKAYSKGYYLYKLADNGITLDWVNVSVDNAFDENEKLIESKLPLLKIIKLEDCSNETISLVENEIKNEIEGQYKELLRVPEYTELRTDCKNQNSCHINLGTDVIKAEFSNNYINAYKNPILSHYGKYVYAIVSKDDELIEQIEKIIKQLP